MSPKSSDMSLRTKRYKVVVKEEAKNKAGGR
jgi:hypothetical protein